MSSTNATSWIQSRLTALYEGASTQDAFGQAFSPACELRLNHVVLPLQTFKDDLLSLRAAATHVSVAWDTELISTNDDKPEQVRVVREPSLVARWLIWGDDAMTMYVSLRSLPARSSSRAPFPFVSARARHRDSRTFISAPSKHPLVPSTLFLIGFRRIEQDPSVQADDQRRITSFYYTSVDRTPPIHFFVPRTAQEGRSDGQ